MMENAIPAGGQGAVEFDESAEVGSVESRISLLRALVEDIRSTGETAFSHQLIVDDRIWTVRVDQTNAQTNAQTASQPQTPSQTSR